MASGYPVLETRSVSKIYGSGSPGSEGGGLRVDLGRAGRVCRHCWPERVWQDDDARASGGSARPPAARY